MVANFISETLTLPTVIGAPEKFLEPLVDCINTDTALPTQPQRKRKIEALYEKLLRNKLENLAQEKS